MNVLNFLSKNMALVTTISTWLNGFFIKTDTTVFCLLCIECFTFCGIWCLIIFLCCRYRRSGYRMLANFSSKNSWPWASLPGSWSLEQRERQPAWKPVDKIFERCVLIWFLLRSKKMNDVFPRSLAYWFTVWVPFVAGAARKPIEWFGYDIIQKWVFYLEQ